MLLTSGQKLDLLASRWQSKLSMVEFSKQSGVSRATLYRWLEVEPKLRDETDVQGTGLFPNPGRPRVIGAPLAVKVKTALASVQSARDAAWKSVTRGKDSFRKTRRPRLKFAEAMDVARAAGYQGSTATFGRFLAEIGFETARKYRYRMGLIGRPKVRKEFQSEFEFNDT